METTKRLYTVTEVAAAADLVPETVEDWTRRGLVEVQAPPAYTLHEALSFAAVRALVGHLLPVYRAAEIADTAIRTQIYDWAALLPKVAKGDVRHVWILASVREEGEMETLLYAGEDVAAQVDLMNHRDASGWTGEARDMGEDDHYRTAAYNIGPDVRRALRILGFEG